MTDTVNLLPGGKRTYYRQIDTLFVRREWEEWANTSDVIYSYRVRVFGLLVHESWRMRPLGVADAVRGAIGEWEGTR